MVYFLSIEVYYDVGFPRSYARRLGFGDDSGFSDGGGPEGILGIGWLSWGLDRLHPVGGVDMARYPCEDG